MFGRGKTTQPDTPADRAAEQKLRLIEQRVSRLDGNALYDFVDLSLYPIGRGVSEFRKGLSPDGLYEAIEGAEQLVIVLQELQRRQ